MDFKKWINESVEQEIESMPMYRGARHGNPENITGPSFFISNELFAKTYGKTAAFKLKLRNPKIVSDDEWSNQYGMPYADRSEAISKLEEEGYDSAVNIRDTFTGKMYAVFLSDPSQATLIDQPNIP